MDQVLNDTCAACGHAKYKIFRKSFSTKKFRKCMLCGLETKIVSLRLSNACPHCNATNKKAIYESFRKESFRKCAACGCYYEGPHGYRDAIACIIFGTFLLCVSLAAENPAGKVCFGVVSTPFIFVGILTLNQRVRDNASEPRGFAVEPTIQPPLASRIVDQPAKPDDSASSSGLPLV